MAIQSAGLEYINLQQVILVNGSMTISGAALRRITAPSLETIGLDFVIQGVSGNAFVSFPALRRVDGRFSLQGIWSQSLEFPALRRAGSIFVSSNPALERLEVPVLESTRSHLQLWQLNKLTNLDLPVAQIGEDLVIAFCWSLQDLNVSNLLEIHEDLEIYVLHSLATIAFPRLTQVGEAGFCKIGM